LDSGVSTSRELRMLSVLSLEEGSSLLRLFPKHILNHDEWTRDRRMYLAFIWEKAGLCDSPDVILGCANVDVE